MGILNSIAKTLLAVCISVNVVAIVGYLGGVRINTTKSIPLGIYLSSEEPITNGSYVFFCPPETEAFSIARERGYISNGFCPGSYGYMMKKVVAMEGDVVSVGNDGLSVNAVPLPNSKQLKADPAGRSLPEYFASRYTLSSAELLLMSDISSTSFDGRYFGPVSSSQVKAVISPIVTWE